MQIRDNQTASKEALFPFAFMNEANEVIDRLNHGTLDFAVMLEPGDPLKYENMSLGISSHWGVLMPSDCPYSDLPCITPQHLRTMPLIMHKRSELQQSISKWAKIEIEKLNPCATYNVMNGNPIHFVTCGLGFLLTTNNLLPDNLDSSV